MAVGEVGTEPTAFLLMTLQSQIDASAPGQEIIAQDEILQYPVIADKKVYIRGPAWIKNGALGDGIFIGLKRAMNSVPNPLDANKVAYRTNNDRRLWLPTKGWLIPPPVTIGIHFTVNAMPTQPVALFGAIDAGLPAPFWCLLDATHITVIGGGRYVQFPSTLTTGNHRLDVFLDTASTNATMDSVPLVSSITGTKPSASPIRTASFGIGGVCDAMNGWGDVNGGPHDFTYNAFKVCQGIKPGMNLFGSETVPNCRLMCDAGPLVHCYGPLGHTYGAMVFVNQQQIDCPTFDNISLPNIRIAGAAKPVFNRCHFYASVTMPGNWPVYPVILNECDWLAGETPLLRLAGAIVWATDISFCPCVCAIQGRSTAFDGSNIFVAGGPGSKNVFDFTGQAIGTIVFRGEGLADYEGYRPETYFYVENSALKGQGPTLHIEDFCVGAPGTVADVVTKGIVTLRTEGLTALGRTPIIQQT